LATLSGGGGFPDAAGGTVHQGDDDGGHGSLHHPGYSKMGGDPWPDDHTGVGHKRNRRKRRPSGRDGDVHHDGSALANAGARHRGHQRVLKRLLLGADWLQYPGQTARWRGGGSGTGGNPHAGTGHARIHILDAAKVGVHCIRQDADARCGRGEPGLDGGSAAPAH
ncbi:MAG: hypothetical protein MJA30_04675, partial [Cytophagales bacterium]|nr:hypothetical protein [Cytophagales bacterium]